MLGLSAIDAGLTIAIQPLTSMFASGVAAGLSQAVAASGQLPEQFRAAFVNGFSNAAHTGFEVGAGQTGANVQTGAAAPGQVQAVAHYVFTHAFVDAMHPTLVLPIVAIVLAAGAVAFVRAPRQPALAIHEDEAAVA